MMKALQAFLASEFGKGCQMVRLIAASALLLSSVAISPAFAAPFTNGDFEQGTDPGSQTQLSAGSTDITGWTVLNYRNASGSDVTYVGSAWAAQNGSRSVELAGSNFGGIQQTFDVVDGQEYKVSFYLSSDVFGPERDGFEALLRATVQSGSNLTSEDFSFERQDGSSASNPGWVLQTFSFVAEGTNATLTFVGLNEGAFGAAIDNVSITAVPVPMALPLMGFALGALGLMRMRGRSAKAD